MEMFYSNMVATASFSYGSKTLAKLASIFKMFPGRENLLWWLKMTFSNDSLQH